MIPVLDLFQLRMRSDSEHPVVVGGFVYIILNYAVVFKSSSICDVVGGALDSQLQEASRGVMF